jgi:hypothetical protein
MWRQSLCIRWSLLMLVAQLGPLGVKEPNEFHVPVVQNLLR